MTKSKIFLGKVITKTLGTAHFAAQSTADLILKTEVESIAKLFDCKDARVDIALSRKHSTRKSQDFVVKSLQAQIKAMDKIKSFSFKNNTKTQKA